eukprot:366555-Chlamydomonas_euryale.AAC.33
MATATLAPSAAHAAEMVPTLTDLAEVYESLAGAKCNQGGCKRAKHGREAGGKQAVGCVGKPMHAHMAFAPPPDMGHQLVGICKQGLRA